MGKLQDRVAVITGGNSGIGRAIAVRFAAEGAHVYVVGRREAELATTVTEIGPRATAIRADITRLEELDAVYRRIAADGRRLDIVVANAGRADRASLAVVDAALFDQIFDLNVRAAFFTVQKALPLLNDGASVLMVASSLDVRGDADMSVYNASKAAVRSLVKTKHNWMVLLSALMGGVLLLAADLLARMLLSPQEMPVGVITAVLGGGYLLWLMYRSQATRAVA